MHGEKTKGVNLMTPKAPESGDKRASGVCAVEMLGSRCACRDVFASHAQTLRRFSLQTHDWNWSWKRRSFTCSKQGVCVYRTSASDITLLCSTVQLALRISFFHVSMEMLTSCSNNDCPYFAGMISVYRHLLYAQKRHSVKFYAKIKTLNLKKKWFFSRFRRFAVSKCSGCQQTIQSDEFVMKARDHLYHQSCFACALCKCVLNPGEYFGMQDDSIYCKLHFDQVDSFHSSNDDMTSSSLTPIHDTEPSAGVPGMAHSDFMPDFPTSHVTTQGLMTHTSISDLIPGLGPPHGPSAGQMQPGHPHMGRGMGAGPPTPFYNGVGVTKKGRPRSRKNQQAHHHAHDLPLLCKLTQYTDSTQSRYLV